SRYPCTRGMICAFTKPAVVPTASVWIGTSFWRTVVTRTSGGGGAGGSALLQALPKTSASWASVSATARDALEMPSSVTAPIRVEPAWVNVASFTVRSGRGDAHPPGRARRLGGPGGRG